MRPRFVANSADIAPSSYWLADEATAPVGSGSSFFAFDTADFEWLGASYVSSYERPAMAEVPAKLLSTTPAADRADAFAASAFAAQSDRVVSTAQPAGDAVIFAPETAPLVYASAAGDVSSSGFVPFATSFIDFSIYPEFEPVSSLLAVANEGPLAALNQGDMVYYLDEGIGASFLRYATAETGGLLGGRDPFDPLTYIMGDTDGDGVTDYIIRMDETGPTLMGTDYII